jgi:FkbM family methyltransferase
VRGLLQRLRRRGAGRPRENGAGRAGFLASAVDHAALVVAETDVGFYAVNPADHGKGRKVFLNRRHPPDDVLGTALEVLAAEGTDPAAGDRWLVDVGAYTGSSAIPAVLRGSFERALAVEPEPGNYRALKANVALNDLEGSVMTERCAVSDEPGAVTMAVNTRMHGKHAVTSEPGRLKAGMVEVEVPADTLDAVLERRGIAPQDVGLLKIDAQGFEDRVLRGAGALLATGVPVVIEYAVDELKQQPGALDRLEAVVAERFSRFADLRRLAADGTPAAAVEFRPADSMPELRAEYLDAASAKKLGQRRGVTDLLLLA